MNGDGGSFYILIDTHFASVPVSRKVDHITGFHHLILDDLDVETNGIRLSGRAVGL